MKEPGKDPQEMFIFNELSEFQRLVGGYIEAVTLASDLVVLCDEEGRLKNYPFNCSIFGVSFVGTIVFVGVTLDGDFCSVFFDFISILFLI